MSPIHPSRRLWAIVLVVAALVLAVDVALALWPEARALKVILAGDASDVPTEILLDGRRVDVFDATGFAVRQVPTGIHELQIARGPDCTVTSCGEGRCPHWCVITTHPIDVPFGLRDESVTIELGPRVVTTLERLRYQMVRIETGTFELDDELRTPATIERPYALGATEVTQALWTEVMGDGPAGDASCVRPDAPHAPVVCVDRPQIQAFLDALTAKDGLDAAHRYRLPSAIEWEFAARAWATSPYGAVREPHKLCLTANVADDAFLAAGGAESVGCDDGFPGVAPVGSLLPNLWGLYDMLGNVAEHVAAEPDATLVPVRGGAWNDGACCVRVASGVLQSFDSRDATTGFRLARTLD